MAGFDSYLLKEDGGKLVLEDGTGDLLLEIAVPVVSTGGVDDGSWYIHAQQLAQAQAERKKREPVPMLLPVLVLDEDGWTDEELAFLMAVDVLA